MKTISRLVNGTILELDNVSRTKYHPYGPYVSHNSEKRHKRGTLNHFDGLKLQHMTHFHVYWGF